MKKINKLRINKIDKLITLYKIYNNYKLSEDIVNNIYNSRKNIYNIMRGKDKRLLVIIGPCSIHDPDAAFDYANRLLEQRKKYSSRLEIVMRTYFEKPRTIVGWKGLIVDPYLDGSFKINDGLKIARKLLIDINKIGLPLATEFLDMSICHFTHDLISWGAIGARTTESQTHREMASSLSCPIGFKNGTDGNIKIAIDAIKSAKHKHLFITFDPNGKMFVYNTSGNKKSHIIMRGGKKPNYKEVDIKNAILLLKKNNLCKNIMIDFSHANCFKNHILQLKVSESICSQICKGNMSISGVMIESFIEEGSQDIKDNNNLIYGKSITDPCLSWEDSKIILKDLANSINCRF
ncbi:3-deoxy-7-phosphoheptulonate synthase [Buchnera aphidicola (Ceratoglyphina bambusae)]|uniref:3-deoxy-7-phosphoheptulonate synthase n=1 Tax=Buchnera aphidicola TaxID=9 RepID=UPI0031B7ED9C